MSLFLSALALGIAFCAPPGAVNAESLRRGLARGFRPAFLIQAGSLIGDTAWAALALLGAAFLVQSLPARLVLGALGVLVSLKLAYSALRDAWRGGEPAFAPVSGRGDFATGALLSLGNPFSVAFWLGVGGSALSGVQAPGAGQVAIFLGGFLVGALAWCLFISALAGWGQRRVGAGFFRALNLVCGGTLAYFGLRLLLSTAEML